MAERVSELGPGVHMPPPSPFQNLKRVEVRRERRGIAPTILRVGCWWLVRGRHGDGWLRLDALNYTREQALAERERLLPTITDEMVEAMYAATRP